MSYELMLRRWQRGEVASSRGSGDVSLYYGKGKKNWVRGVGVS